MSKHAVILDDDADDLDIFAIAIAAIDLRVDVTYIDHPLQALSLLEQMQADIIFVDFNMPVMNGIEFIERMKKKHIHLQTPIIIYSTNITDTTKEKANNLGIRQCLVKPNTVEELSHALEKIFMTLK